MRAAAQGWRRQAGPLTRRSRGNCFAHAWHEPGTVQTGPSGRIVKRLLIEEGLDIKRELYLSLLVDRASAHVIFMASAAGGMEIEGVAKKRSRLDSREIIHPRDRPAALSSAQTGFGLGLSGEAANRAAPFFPGVASRVR